MLPPMFARRAVLASLPLALPVLLSFALGAAACGGSPSPAVPVAPTVPPVAKVELPAPDVSEVPEPAMMVAVARVKNADASMKVLNDWLKVPVIDSKGVLDELFDAEVSEVFDPTRPTDAAVSVGGSILTKPTVYAAVSVSVRSLDMAKTRLEAAGMRVTGKPDGQWLVEGVGKGGKKNVKRRAGSTPHCASEVERRLSRSSTICLSLRSRRSISVIKSSESMMALAVFSFFSRWALGRQVCHGSNRPMGGRFRNLQVVSPIIKKLALVQVQGSDHND